jgi:hypothetical protein
MPKPLTGRGRRARELRDACLLLVARHGLASRQGDAPATEVVLGPFRIRLIPSGARREVEVWHVDAGAGAGAGGGKVLSLRWSGEDFTVLGFRRGAWEQELLALGGPRRLLALIRPSSPLRCPVPGTLNFPIFGHEWESRVPWAYRKPRAEGVDHHAFSPQPLIIA